MVKNSVLSNLDILIRKLTKKKVCKMAEQTFEERLKQLRKIYLENEVKDKKLQEINAFMNSSKEDENKKIKARLAEIDSETYRLENALQNPLNNTVERENLKHNLEALKDKRKLMLRKLELIQKDECNEAKRERIKRQLAELEFKRCRLRLNNKDYSKLDKKIQEKQRQYRKDFTSES